MKYIRSYTEIEIDPAASAWCLYSGKFSKINHYNNLEMLIICTAVKERQGTHQTRQIGSWPVQFVFSLEASLSPGLSGLVTDRGRASNCSQYERNVLRSGLLSEQFLPVVPVQDSQSPGNSLYILSGASLRIILTFIHKFRMLVLLQLTAESQARYKKAGKCYK